MARYIDADKFRQELIFKQLYCGDDTAERHALGIVIAELDGTPTVDVVPKSEVEELIRENESLEKTVNEASSLIRKLRNKVEKSQTEVARRFLRRLSELALILLATFTLEQLTEHLPNSKRSIRRAMRSSSLSIAILFLSVKKTNSMRKAITMHSKMLRSL